MDDNFNDDSTNTNDGTVGGNVHIEGNETNSHWFVFNKTLGTTNLTALADPTNADMTLANSFGSIQWSGVNVKNQIFSDYVLIGDEFVSLNPSPLNSTINGAANVSLSVDSCPRDIYYWENESFSREEIVSNGVICNDCTNIVCTSNVLNFTVAHFDSYAANVSAADTIPPLVFDLVPVQGSTFNVSDVIEIGANVTDNIAVDNVSANLTFPNGTVQQLFLGNVAGDPTFDFIQNSIENAPERSKSSLSVIFM